MAEFTEKNYFKFFGQNLLTDILKMDKDLAEEFQVTLETKQVAESFDTQASLLLDEELDVQADEIESLYS